jgi:hypothetical protein
MSDLPSKNVQNLTISPHLTQIIVCRLTDIECLLYIQHCSKFRKYISEKKNRKKIPALTALAFS